MPWTIIITWMDGQQGTYSCSRFENNDYGVLILTSDRGATGPSSYRIPLANVRVYKVERT